MSFAYFLFSVFTCRVRYCALQPLAGHNHPGITIAIRTPTAVRHSLICVRQLRLTSPVLNESVLCVFKSSTVIHRGWRQRQLAASAQDSLLPHAPVVLQDMATAIAEAVATAYLAEVRLPRKHSTWCCICAASQYV